MSVTSPSFREPTLSGIRPLETPSEHIVKKSYHSRDHIHLLDQACWDSDVHKLEMLRSDVLRKLYIYIPPTPNAKRWTRGNRLAVSPIQKEKCFSLSLEVKHRAAPSERGTFNLLSSCLLTLSISVFSALHLNVTRKNTSKTGILLHKLKWMTIGIIAPEVLLFNAWSQWRSARHLTAQF